VALTFVGSLAAGFFLNLGEDFPLLVPPAPVIHEAFARTSDVASRFTV